MFSQGSADFKTNISESRYDKYMSQSQMRDSTIAPGEIPWSLDSSKVILSLNSTLDQKIQNKPLIDTKDEEEVEQELKETPKPKKKLQETKSLRKRSTNDRRKFFKTITKGNFHELGIA